MKSSIFPFLIFLSVLLLLFNACDKVTIDFTPDPLPTHQKDEKPATPVPLGTVRAYFGEYYKTFSEQIDKAKSIDSMSNAYYYRENDLNSIQILRSDSEFIIAIYLSGYSIDSLPLNKPLPEVYGKYPQIQFHPFGSSGWGDPSYYSLAYYLKKCVFIITDKTDDILTGTFDGMLESSTGSVIPLTDGEFKIKIFRKKM